MKSKLFIRSGMTEFEPARMQKRPPEFFNRLRKLRRATAYSVYSIKGVSHNRVAFLRQMNSNLVSSSCFDPDAQQRHEPIVLFQEVIMFRVANIRQVRV